MYVVYETLLVVVWDNSEIVLLLDSMALLALFKLVFVVSKLLFIESKLWIKIYSIKPYIMLKKFSSHVYNIVVSPHDIISI